VHLPAQGGHSSSKSLPSASSVSELSFSSNSSPAVVLASTAICSTSDNGYRSSFGEVIAVDQGAL
jgi:hypothetical protein